MEHSYPSKLQVWSAWPPTEALSPDLPTLDRSLLAPPVAVALADRLYVRECLHPPACAECPEDGPEPYSLQWFLEIETQRHLRRAAWLPRLLEFSKHAGETLLGIGAGLGTDWVQYARHGASVVVCSSAVEQLALVRRNFELRGLGGRFLLASPGTLPVDSSSIDVVCVNSLLHGVQDVAGLAEEVYRVLKPGGKVLAVAAASYDVKFWSRLALPWRRWLSPPSVESGVHSFSTRRLRKVFHRFVEHRVHKRHLHRSEVPYCWRWLPTSVLQRLMGRLLVIKAFKPLSAAIPVPLAA